MNDIVENPYSAPEADLEKPQQANDLRVFTRFTTWAVFGLSIITLGFYTIYWLYNRTEKLNSIIEDKISKGYMIATTVVYILSMLLSYAPLAVGQGSEMMIVAQPIISLVSAIMMLIWVFKFRNRLNRITQSEGKPTWCGPILTFFFQTLYLNYKINQNLDMRNSTDQA
ncbi:DUF4234 domain-containing protein [Neptuniibacter sp.]|uniref:DUF4234 domain-containing protein n=1 Tax=Neptuniibacter sp. TaxID=1962643 RepID=UPI002614D328|nr:DUF4234 domain-containing protein [Neptuniibacter sp.]MCP4597234.1 DUF4234 domain-containing protein [Neptuniibacter sp.]